MYLAALLMSDPPVNTKDERSDGALHRPISLTSVFWEILFKRCLGQLHLENINLVQEQNDRSSQEPPGIDD
jgi:hypothetical protein